MTIDRVLSVLESTVGRTDSRSLQVVGGGSINDCYAFKTEDGSRYFLKLNHASARHMFDAERDGLAELERAGAVRVPHALASDTAGESAYLLLEFLDFGGDSTAGGARLGERLAEQHRVRNEAFGWFRDNTIGSTAQINTRSSDWVGFLRDARLGYQLRLAADNGLASGVAVRGERLLGQLSGLFAGYTPEASLLHGDLWGGNWGVIAGGEPVIFDPAVYYGDREADIAMTQLFGGFGPDFYAAYNAAWPLDPGFSRRADLYNLYHVLNHFNLFGGGYQRQAAALLDRLLA